MPFLDYFELTALADKRIGQLSGGEQQRANIVRALLQNASVILLDEPCNHLDIRHRHRLMQYLNDNKPFFISIMVLHDLNLAARYADHIILINKGKPAAEGKSCEILKSPLPEEIYGWPLERICDGDRVYFKV
ncbi:ATP-binding cassette domain-containing protein [Neisseria chenwenguii]|uniref:ATP-binding cassette domain-containing protein n=1 Tax=Neisseria chenwenguii TaxID=1853278 RepID=UPI002279DCBC|nr:ABC transporter ATP-binding protein [Neisseria chenwenguii]